MTQLEELGLGDVLRCAGAQILPRTLPYAQRVVGDAMRWDSVDPGLPSEWAIHHPALQTALLEHARECDVRVLRPARVTRFWRERGARMEVVTEDGVCEVRARLVIGADGRQSAARRAWAAVVLP